MAASTRPTLPARLHDLAAMASLLERLDNTPPAGGAAGAASADQYRHVVQQVGVLLAQAEPGAALDALLAAAPASAEIYENQRYAVAGLCRSPLEPAFEAEIAAAAAIARARRRD